MSKITSTLAPIYNSASLMTATAVLSIASAFYFYTPPKWPSIINPSLAISIGSGVLGVLSSGLLVRANCNGIKRCQVKVQAMTQELDEILEMDGKIKKLEWDTIEL